MKIYYYSGIIETYKNNMNKTWQILSTALGKKADKKELPPFFTINEEQISDRSKIAEAFNNYFSSIGKKTSEAVPKSTNDFAHYLDNPNPNSMFLEPVEPSYVLNIVHKLKPKNSSGHDQIPTSLVKETIDNIIVPVTHIINRSLETGIFPHQLKIAKVLPIFKAAEKNLLANYRPISLLPAFSKILEKVMCKKILSFMNSQNLFYKHQYGFRPKHSTIHPIIHLLNEVAQAENAVPNKMTLSILCDLSKAFDVINHNILFTKLEFYGIRGVVKDWLVSYLSNRTQFVEIENKKSNESAIECGVPQGSILGPLLYLIYVNDIYKATRGTILSFADDTSLLIQEVNPETLFQQANIEINNLYQWFCANKLSLNAKKTKYLVIRGPHSKCNFNNLQVKIGDTPLCQIGSNFEEKSTKFLGLHIDEFLTWKFHITHINAKISRALFQIKQAKKLLPINCLRTLYYSMIHPYLLYGILAWGNIKPSSIKRTVILQKRAMRYISKTSYNSHTEPLFKKMEILKLNDLYDYQVILFMHTYVNNQLPISFDGIFKYNRDFRENRETRQSNLFHCARCRSNIAISLPLYNFQKI